MKNKNNTQTKINSNCNTRTLETICRGSFHIYIRGGIYCKIGLTKKIGCFFQKKKKDPNGFYFCSNVGAKNNFNYS